MTPTDPGPRVSGHKITLEDVIGNKFKPNPRNATWSKGGTQADILAMFDDVFRCTTLFAQSQVGVVKAFIGNISLKMFNGKILKFYFEGENSSHCSSKLADIII